MLQGINTIKFSVIIFCGMNFAVGWAHRYNNYLWVGRTRLPHAVEHVVGLPVSKEASVLVVYVC